MSRPIFGRPAGLMLVSVMLLLPLSAQASSAKAFSTQASSTASSDQQNPDQKTIPAIPLDEAVMGGGLVVVQAHTETLRPAPLPDPDVSPPGPSSETLASQSSPSVAPDFFNPNAHAIGDGYAPGSAIETDHNNRHSTGGGMSLSIPMQ